MACVVACAFDGEACAFDVVTCVEACCVVCVVACVDAELRLHLKTRP